MDNNLRPWAVEAGDHEEGRGLEGAGEEEGGRIGGGGRGGRRGRQNAVLKGDVEVGVRESDVALVVCEDQGAFHEQRRGQITFLLERSQEEHRVKGHDNVDCETREKRRSARIEAPCGQGTG
jgi:hypothetical protein